MKYGHATAGREVVVDDGGGVGRRAPPALELARVGPQLPGALDGGVELGGDRHAQRFGILVDVRDGHGVAPSVRFVGEQVADPVDAAAPDGLQLVEQACGPTHGVDVAAHELLATLALLGHEARALEHRDVLLDGREAHRVAAGELGDVVRALERAQEDVAPGGVGELDPDVDPDLLVDLLSGPLFYRQLVRRERTSDDRVVDMVDAVLSVARRT